MAKYMAKRKHGKEKQAIHPNRTGKFGQVGATLAHNAHTNRYNLSVDGGLILSHLSHAACLRRAEAYEVVWQAA